MSFQFPSNGKAYPKSTLPATNTSLGNQAFQFPSNGKAYPKVGIYLTQRDSMRSFNSLQTGKPIQSHNRNCDIAIKACLFQFPSNGKAYPKYFESFNNHATADVRFNSLQTGKPIQSPAWHECQIYGRTCVSIPFKRESLSKVRIVRSIGWRLNPLVSIPFKRESLSKDKRGIKNSTAEIQAFQFPSNGKAYPKKRVYLIRINQWQLVSIPFKRESLSKDGKRQLNAVAVQCFNSLQTGKPIQSVTRTMITPLRLLLGFNSLQTGKPIQSYHVCRLRWTPFPGFNSLQTGKPIQSSLNAWMM